MSVWSRLKATLSPGSARPRETRPATDDEFVGRTTGQDSGYLETGAEKRAEEDGESATETER